MVKGSKKVGKVHDNFWGKLHDNLQKGAIGEESIYWMLKDIGLHVAKYGYENTVEPQRLLNGCTTHSYDQSLRKRPDLITLSRNENGTFRTVPIEVKTRKKLHPNIILDNDTIRKYYPESIFVVVCKEEPHLLAQYSSKLNTLNDFEPFDSIFYVGDENQSIFDCYKEAAEYWLGVAQ